MRVFASVLAATILLSAPAAFGQSDPGAAPPTATATTEPSSPAPTATEGAAPATPDAEQSQSQATDADHRMVCHYAESTESRLRRSRQRVCATRQQWETTQDLNSRDVQQMGSVQTQRSN